MSGPRLDRKRLTLLVEGRISPNDAKRQEATAQEILQRFERQPGVVLADEVGMGKTFVALSVAVTMAWGDKRRRPVVVMVPPSLRDKWPRDFETFRTHCIQRDEDRVESHLRVRSAKNGVEFFRLLDDPRSRRAHIIFLTHGALYGTLRDPWVKLAILRRALQLKRFGNRRLALPRFAAEILQVGSKYGDPELFRRLMAKKPELWRDIIAEYGDDIGDDPVPEAIWKALRKGRIDLSELRDALWELPIRSSPRMAERVLNVRRSLNATIRHVWHQSLIQANFCSPLLVMDEAHHLKNPATRLASLFVEPEAKEDAQLLEGALQGSFERMLFLTATPFQLGHHELLSVVRRFSAIRWKKGSPRMTQDEFDKRHRELELRLDSAQRNATLLDQRWGTLTADDVADADGIEAWWNNACGDPEAQPERVQMVLRAYQRAHDAMREAERVLQPWIVRHLRSREFQGTNVKRRKEFPGAAILDDSTEAHPAGLEVNNEAVLPFLLAARTQAVVARGDRRMRDTQVRRATFAEGLASSYEAFLETRAGANVAKIVDEDADIHTGSSADGYSSVEWYLKRLKRALPDDSAHIEHPKISSTLKRVRALWEKGEKVLVFCHYRATGTALARHLSAGVADYIRSVAAGQLGCDESEVAAELERLGDRFNPDRPLHRSLLSVVDELVAGHEELERKDVESIFDVVRRFVRTPAFLVRFFPLGAGDPNRAFRRALSRTDASGLSLRDKLTQFIEFLAKWCEPQLRDEYLEALGAMQTGVRYGGRRFGRLGDDAFELQPSVRRATGMDKHEERRRSLLGFNTPFFPEILIASSVMAEGVDLHLDCRHVIHHDLCWNPSTLEQRTGRVDRIGAKAERVGEPIHVYLPYIAATQDEKMFRVVKDRQRWFQVLMGEDYVVDEAHTDRLEARVPLPESAARRLAFHLEVYNA